MSFIKKIVNNTLGNETIGEIKKEHPKKKEKEHSKITQKLKKDNIVQPEENQDIKVDKTVLDFLGIDLNVDLSGLITSEDIANFEFSISVPSGANPDEVEQALTKIEIDISKYISIIQSRQRDFLILLKEVNKLTDQLVEAKQAEEISNFIGGNANEDKILELQDKILDLNTKCIDLEEENRKLKKQLASQKSTSPPVTNKNSEEALSNHSSSNRFKIEPRFKKIEKSSKEEEKLSSLKDRFSRLEEGKTND